jgi:transketolase
MRDAFSNTLVSLAKADPNVLLLTGDHGYALLDAFRRECPTQYINAGIAEQNMVGMAAGLARAGFKPFVYGLAAFIPVRVIEQIKLDVAHDKLPVIFIGDGAGFVYSHLGTSHQSTEDIACTRALPNLDIYSPADRFELEACMMCAYKENQPSYMRIGKSDLGDVHEGKIKFNRGHVYQVKEGVNMGMAFIATGSMVKESLNIAAKYFPEASVWSLPSIKPINTETIVEICSTSSLIVTLEEHSIIGGVGSLIAEIASENAPIRILRIGVNDRFSESAGTYEYLKKEHRVDEAAIADKVKKFIRIMI